MYAKSAAATLVPDAARAEHVSGVNEREREGEKRGKNADAINAPRPGSRWAGLCCHDDDVNVGVE